MKILDLITKFLNDNKDVLLNISNRFDGTIDIICDDDICLDFMTNQTWCIVSYQTEKYIAFTIEETRIDIIINRKSLGVVISKRLYENHIIEIFPIEFMTNDDNIETLILLSTEHYSAYKEDL